VQFINFVGSKKLASGAFSNHAIFAKPICNGSAFISVVLNLGFANHQIFSKISKISTGREDFQDFHGKITRYSREDFQG